MMKWCIHGQHHAPADDFRTVPGVKNKRKVCSVCYARIIEGRKGKK